MRLIFALFIVLFSFNSFAFSTSAKSAILMDYETGEIVFEKNSNQQFPPSSMSKLMTLYVVFEKIKNKEISLDSKFIVSEKSWRKQGSKMFLKLNSRVSVDELIRGIIVLSGNDACIAIAEGLMGSEKDFAELMNEKAQELGLTQSQFKNATGWPDKGHLMSARDIAHLSYRIIKDFPEFMEYFAQKQFTHSGITQNNRNSLLNLNIGADGLKTGHTEIGGYSLAATAKQKNRRFISVVNGLKSNAARTRESEKLLQYGFIRFSNFITPVTKKIDILPVNGGVEQEIGVYLEKPVKLTIEKKYLNKVEIIINKKTPAIAPIEKGQVMAEMIIKIPGREEMSYNLIALNNVDKANVIVRKYRQIKNLLSW